MRKPLHQANGSRGAGLNAEALARGKRATAEAWPALTVAVS
jgi:hypothetical protein